jgi:hypothetical protein
MLDNPLPPKTSPLANINSDGPFDTLAVFGPPNPLFMPPISMPSAAFDTANAGTLPIRVRAIQVRIRIYDPKLQNARQMTIVQNL